VGNHPHSPDEDEKGRIVQPLGSGVRGVFWSVAVLTALTGLAMFALAQLAGESLWPFRIAPVGARFWGMLFLSIALGAALSARAADGLLLGPMTLPCATPTGARRRN